MYNLLKMKSVFYLIILYSLYTNNAYAYLDPGGLFSMLGMFFAAIISAFIVIKHKIFELFKKISKKK